MKPLLAVALAALLTAQTFRTGVEGVRVDVRVTAGGHPVAGLTAGDFDLRDAGVPQTVRAVSIEDLPLSMLVALDVSNSVERALPDLKSATLSAIAALRPDDRASLLSFGSWVRRLSPFTTDRRRLAGAVAHLEIGGATSAFDAAFAALTLRDPRGGRPLVLFVSDGFDTISWLPEEAVLDAARRSDVVVYAVSLRHPLLPAPFRIEGAAHLPLGFDKKVRADEFLQRLAGTTGGDVLYADTTKDLAARFVAIVEEFKTRYLLTYTPVGVPQGGWHPIEVSVRHPGATVTARRGYER